MNSADMKKRIAGLRRIAANAEKNGHKDVEYVVKGLISGICDSIPDVEYLEKLANAAREYYDAGVQINLCECKTYPSRCEHARRYNKAVDQFDAVFDADSELRRKVSQ